MSAKRKQGKKHCLATPTPPLVAKSTVHRHTQKPSQLHWSPQLAEMLQAKKKTRVFKCLFSFRNWYLGQGRFQVLFFYENKYFRASRNTKTTISWGNRLRIKDILFLILSLSKICNKSTVKERIETSCFDRHWPRPVPWERSQFWDGNVLGWLHCTHWGSRSIGFLPRPTQTLLHVCASQSQDSVYATWFTLKGRKGWIHIRQQKVTFSLLERNW